jgi:TatA/E family protein of Tat protein translocase
MNIFGLGPMEILLILVIALIVFGPQRLPEIMGKVGKAIADFRRATSQLSDEFNRTIQAELQETRSVMEDTRSAVTGVHTSINAALAGTTTTTPAPARTAVPGEVQPAASNGTNGSVAVENRPPLADTSQWSWESTAPAPVQPPVQVAAPPVVTSAAPPVRKAKLGDDLLPPY